MKKWAVYFKTESCDDYHRFFESKKKPSIKQLIDYFCREVESDDSGEYDESFHPIKEVTEIQFEKL